jgi:hypothetical protein
LESILRFHGYSYSRPDPASEVRHEVSDALRVTLLPTGLEARQNMLTGRADVVIAFDESFRKSPFDSHVLRQDINGKLSLLISLVVTNSAEHIELCVPKSTTGLARTRILARAIWQTRRKLGIPDENSLPEDVAIKAAEFLMSKYIDPHGDPQYGPWQVPDLPEIRGALPSSPELVGEQSRSTTQSRDETKVKSPGPNFKRSLVSYSILHYFCC